MTNHIKQTGDGSTTLISEQFDQPYHSLGGAVSESRYVYFESTGLHNQLSSSETDKLHILEIGFGSGMNLVLLMDYLLKSDQKVSVTFVSVEAYPIQQDLISKIDFGNDLAYLGYHDLLRGVFSNHSSGWNNYQITKEITLDLFIGTFKEIEFIHDKGTLNIHPAVKGTQDTPFSQKIGTDRGRYIHHPFNYIFHDPFSPDSNPDGWRPDLFKKIAKASAPDAMLSTYSAATSARAAMAAGGWKIARAPGALGKREMTVASLNPEKLLHLKRVNENRLIERFENGEFKL